MFDFLTTFFAGDFFEKAAKIAALLGAVYTFWLLGRLRFLDSLSACLLCAKNKTFSAPNMNLLAVKVLYEEKLFLTYEDKNIISEEIPNDPFKFEDDILESLSTLQGVKAEKILKAVKSIAETNEKSSFLKFLPAFLVSFLSSISYFILTFFGVFFCCRITKRYWMLFGLSKDIEKHDFTVDKTFIPEKLDKLMKLYGYDEDEHAKRTGVIRE